MARLWKKSEMLINGGIALSLYRSSRSRLVVAVGDVPGPMVNGCISFVTETNCDDGLPHTLEHLVFMGSKKYPYKGVLDIIANRCLASGTNAWTDQDHTAYTLSTVGCEGFFKVLPVYINHLLSPTLTDAQFVTEVHHVNGDGENAGVVYSEMQDHESEMESIMERKRKEVMFPPNTPYAVDSGGRLKNLRETCTVDRVREFHSRFYHLSNMMVTVCGRVDHTRLLNILEGVEEEQLPNVPVEFPRPFSFSINPLMESSDHHVVCPSDDNSRGIVEISWFGSSPSDFATGSALNVLFDYMSNTPVSPLQKDFVLLDKPLASGVHFSISEQVTNIIHLQFSGVPSKYLNEVKSKFMDKTVCEHVDESSWDMERMGFLIDQNIMNELVKLETDAHNEIFGHMIGHQLFGNDNDESLKDRVNEVNILRRLKTEPASFWAELVRRYFTSNHVAIVGIPDEKMVNKIAKEEKKRLYAQQKALGQEGLKICAEKVAAAIKENVANKPTDELLDELIVKNLESFDRFPVIAKSNKSTKAYSEREKLFLEQFPFPVTLHDCASKFVEIFLLLDSSALTVEQRAYLLIFNDLLFESPAIIDGNYTSAEEVSKLYTKDLIDHSIEVGISGHFDRFVDLRLKVDAEKGFPYLAKWAEIFTRGIVFDASRVKMSAQKLASDACEKKRDGCSVAGTAITSLLYDQNSNSHLYDEIVLEKFHEKIAAECDRNPDLVVQKLEELRTVLFSCGLNAHFICNVDLIDSKLYGAEQWQFALGGFGPSKKFEVSTGEAVLSTNIGRQQVFPVGGSESSFIYQSCLFDCEWFDEAFIPTMLFTQYLSQCEGPLWRGIRGDGLAYGANIYVKSSRKLISLSLYRCSQPIQAYQQTKEIVMNISSSEKIDEYDFEAAKRSLVFELVQKEGTVSSAGKLSILGILRDLPTDYNKEICQRIWNTSSDDMIRLGGPRVVNLFENFTRAIATHPSKVSEIKRAFPGIESATVASLNYRI